MSEAPNTAARDADAVDPYALNGQHVAQAIYFAARGIPVVPLWADPDNGDGPTTEEVVVRRLWQEFPGSPVLVEIKGTLHPAPEPGSLRG
ncbi:MAG: hypothetical protein IID41_14530, partial [Planctomycetes bacterium]|nr:hypothetical protein [Planctomycetota bacterium]